MTISLTPATYDGVCSMLIGNGSICTTVGPTGYHASPDRQCHEAHATQRFAWAGRREPGPRHRLTDFGSLSRTLFVNNGRMSDADWTQRLDCGQAIVETRLRHPNLAETTRSLAVLGANVFMAETELAATARCTARFDVLYTTGDISRRLGPPEVQADAIAIPYSTRNDVGTVRISSAASDGTRPLTSVTAHAVRFSYRLTLDPGCPVVIRTLIQFSDRLDYGFPVALKDWADLMETHLDAWRDFHATSALETGNDTIDRFRAVSLYTIRAQLSDWSIGPTLSERYWGGGAFHDEMYPFFGLVSSGHPDLALRLPRFRLLTLGEAVRRARGRGALYPWSSTETGAERDPEGLWLTERFHLAQFSAQIWAHWLYERNIEELDHLYPVLQQIARYMELNVIERSESGVTGTRACVDFDESVGAVKNGPFTVSGAAAALHWAAEAASALGRDTFAVSRWRALSAELRNAIVAAHLDAPDSGEVFGIPEGVPLHYSVLGHIFPFMTEPWSDRARRTARYIHRVCRSSHGWRPGAADAYTDSNWAWTAGHLAIVHAMQGDAERAWEAVSVGPEGSGPGPIPCEHLDRNGIARVPWFTTGVGAWLYGLHATIAWVSDAGTHLWSGIPSRCNEIAFRGLRGGHGVTISGESASNRCPTIMASAREALDGWRFTVPRSALVGARVHGTQVSEDADSVTYEVPLPPNRSVVLIESAAG